jgi:adenylosuccinate synthase
MAKVDVLLGLQWGDEGKGKVVDYLAPKYDVVARFQGGPNAGHTLEFEGIKHVLHQIPSGIFHEGILNVIGNGVVIDPITFRKEIEALDKFNLDLKKHLVLSNKAQLILPTHRLLDQAYESLKGENKIGSTLRGIGPTYQDKIGRLGLRIGDVLRADFLTKYNALKNQHLEVLDKLGFGDVDENFDEAFHSAVDILRSFSILSTEYLINEQIGAGKRVLAEGAQGSMLDIDFGSYPFVTSSNTTTAGACTGLGISPRNIGEVFGIFKAYCTRVGSGPFPTELTNEIGEDLRKRGHEFGATTGRPRRCGWLDLPALNYACMLNGVTQLFMMKTDVLSGMSEIGICEKYLNVENESQLPFYYSGDSIEAAFKTIPVWNEFQNKKSFSELPQELIDFINRIETYTNTPIGLISHGPDRKETIFKN